MSESEKAMRAIDTNVLVRMFISDEPHQFHRVQSLVRGCQKSEQALFVPLIVVVELVWVLSRIYGFPREVVVDRLEQLMASPILVIERDLTVADALDQYRRGPADFADYLIGAIAQEAGCRDTVTFDRKLRSASGFTVLE